MLQVQPQKSFLFFMPSLYKDYVLRLLDLMGEVAFLFPLGFAGGVGNAEAAAFLHCDLSLRTGNSSFASITYKGCCTVSNCIEDPPTPPPPILFFLMLKNGYFTTTRNYHNNKKHDTTSASPLLLVTNSCIVSKHFLQYRAPPGNCTPVLPCAG